MFIIVILYIVGVYFYSDSLKKNIDEQKEEMTRFNDILSQTEQLIITVQEAQNIMNENLISSKAVSQLQFDSISAEVSDLIYSLSHAMPQKDKSIFLEDIDSLLIEKRAIINTLTEKLKQSNPIQQIDKKIETYDEIIKDSVIVTTSKDTTFVIKEKEEKRDIWSRFKNFVKPTQKQDTVIQISEVEKETILTSRVDTVISSDLKSAAREASMTYSVQIIGIERQVRELILAEQNISLQISKLLTEFYNETTQITQKGMRESELLTQRIFTFAIFIGALSLFLLIIIILFIVSDLNKGRKARFDLAAEKQLTETLMNSRHKLLLSVSHDIKTPLSSIMGYMQMWDNNTKAQQETQQLKSAQNSAQHILNLLSNLLEFSRLEQNNAVLHNSRFNLNELLREVIQMFQPLADEKKLTIKQELLPEDPFYVETDFTVLKQILNNIISNAIKYTFEGTVTVRSIYDNNKLIFVITDTGIGMTQHELNEIYKPFSRSEAQFASEGSGFGMYVTKGLIQALSGEIKVESEKEKGTRVTIYLPLHPDTSFEKNPNTNHEILPLKDIRNILIFEDDLSLGKMIKTFLSQNNYHVELCNDYKNIDDCISRVSDFDIVFTDMDMIKVDGHEILDKIRKVNPEIPVWLMTANDDYIAQKAMLRGFNGLIEKPIQLQRLSEILAVKTTSQTNENNLAQQFPTLSAMMGEDEESIRDILATFVKSARQDIADLSRMTATSDFKQAQQLCHRMHPFITQIGGGDVCDILIKMDNLRGKDETVYPHWKTELSESIQQIKSYIDKIEKEHLI